jgi:signal transduction histidine kinase
MPIVFLLSIILFYIGNIEVNRSTIKENLTKDIASQLHKDSITILKYHNSDDDRAILNTLNESLLSAEIIKNDSLIFWNFASSTDQPVRDNDLLLATIKGNNTIGKISLNYAAYNQKIRHQCLRLVQDSLTENIEIAGQKVGLAFDNIYKYPLAKSIGWWLLFLSFGLLTISLAQYIKSRFIAKQSVRLLSISLFAVSILFKGLHYWQPFLEFLGSFNLIKTLNESTLANQSIAHLIINLWIFGLAIYIGNIFIQGIRLNAKNQGILTLISGLYTTVIFGFATNIIEGFVLSDYINLEIESLMQFNVISFLLIICFSMMMILIFQSTQMCYEIINQRPFSLYHKLGLTSIGWLLGLGILTSIFHLHVPIWIFLIFIMSYTLILDAYTENREKKITYLIWWLIMFSGFLAVVLFYFGLKKDVAERVTFLEQYYAESDDRVVKEMVTLQDSLIQRDVFSKIASLEATSRLDMKDLYEFMFDKLPTNNDAYEISIELFERSTGATLFNNHFADYYKLDQSYLNARQVGRHVYHNPFEDKYITRLEILRTSSNASWYIFIIYQHRSTKKNAHLLHQKYGFAVYSKGKLIEKSDNNQAAPDLNQLSNIEENKIHGGYSYVIAQPSDQYKIVSWKKVSGLIKPISLFSFIFTLSGILLLLLSLINTKYDFLPENISLKFGARSSLKTKIQLAIILLILVTFLIIGAITGFYFKNLIEANQYIKHKEETASITNNIKSDILNLVDDEYALTFLNSKLKELSFIHDKDLSLYDQFGQLVSSTSSKDIPMHIPFDVYNLSSDRNSSANRPSLATDRAYVPFYLNEAKAFAYVGIDHSAYNNSSGNILDFLSTILNAYIFLFLIAGAIAITIANSITQPLTILAEKLKKFKLGKSNEQLEWNSNDEIGTLIHDYNNLTHELERSAGLLAKTERDMAWREMAKQVAHEIKNPLTPMKLSIQYLDRTAKDYPDKAQELIPRISSTLIEQIDNLSQIANEFSNFASMPQASNEKIILNEIVETIHDLFRKRDDMDINMIEPIDDLYVFADKNHLVRILNNLLKNAIQAIPENRRGKIEIELKRHENDALIRISDNGSGIPDHMKDKVFTPNFTTKSSGTGLGLAISANMIESFNGRIYFETKVGQGTDFYVSIPLMRLDDYLSDEYRVSLD